MTGADPVSRGSAVQATLSFLEGEGGAALVDDVLARIDPEARRRIQEVGATEEAPYPLVVTLWRAANEVLGPVTPDWMERAGAWSIQSSGQQLYGGILRKASPQEFLTQSVSLFRLYYHPGDMEVVESSPGHAVLRLVGFEAIDPLFCRRQTGGLKRAIEIAGGTAARVRHVRCVLEGDAFCEWDLRWT
jgi:hypothetical protein